MDEADDHFGVPRDADGVPVFFVLPAELQASYDKRMARCERGWQATGDPAFVSEAQILVHLHRQPPLLWLSEAICMLAVKRRTKGHVTRAFNAAIRRMRYEAVRDAKHEGRTWHEAYEHAADVLASTRAAAELSTMESAYKQVKRDLKQGRFGLYAMPKMSREKLGDVLSRKSSPR
jgi:hypothetical protein